MKNPPGRAKKRARRSPSESARGSTTRLRSLVICVGLSVITLVAFAGVTDNGFVWDDEEYVTKNADLRNGLDAGTLTWAFTTGHSSNWHPVTWLSHGLDVELFGLDSAAHHRTSLVIHIMSTVLLFLVLQRMTGASWTCAAVAALFAVHPLRVESVAWISERKDVLSTFFWISTIAAYAWYAGRRSVARYGVVLALFALGLMSKQMLVSLPVVLLLLDYWPLARLRLPRSEGVTDDDSISVGGGAADRVLPLSRLAVEKVPFLLLSVAASAAAIVAQSRGGSVASLDVYPWVDRLQNAIVSYVAYVGKLIWPARFSPFYPFRFDLTMWQVGGAALALVAVSYWAIRSIRRRPYVAVGWFWYLVCLVPVIGLVQIGQQAMADRYTYIPGIGLLIVVCWLVRDLGRRRRGATAVVAVATAVVLIALTLKTQAQVRYWRDDETLFRHAVEVTPASSLAHLNLGRELVRQGNIEAAAPHFQRSLEIKPDHDVAHNNLGMAALYGDRIEQAIDCFERAVAIDPGQAMYHANLAAALATAGRYDESANQFAEAVRLDPRSTVVVAGLASHMTSLASIMFRGGRINPATKLLEGAVVVDPDLLSARIGLGRALIAGGRVEDALEQFRSAVELVSGLNRESLEHDRSVTSQVHFSYGYALAAAGRPKAAAEQYRQALRREPELANATVGLAWLLATTDDDGLRDSEEALRRAAEACRLTGNRNPKALDALAAAYAAGGRFEEAVAVAERAIVAAAGRPALVDAIRHRADGYRAGMPYTERALSLDE